MGRLPSAPLREITKKPLRNSAPPREITKKTPRNSAPSREITKKLRETLRLRVR